MPDRDLMVRDLRVRLQDEEKIAKSILHAKACDDIAQLDEEKAMVMRRFGEKLKGLKLSESKLRYDVQTGTEERPVECEEKHRYRELAVDIIRMDTDEVIETRPMTNAERQTKLNLVPFPKRPAPSDEETPPDTDSKH